VKTIGQVWSSLGGLKQQRKAWLSSAYFYAHASTQTHRNTHQSTQKHSKRSMQH
jgi:hypothetical protein